MAPWRGPLLKYLPYPLRLQQPGSFGLHDVLIPMVYGPVSNIPSSETEGNAYLPQWVLSSQINTVGLLFKCAGPAHWKPIWPLWPKGAQELKINTTLCRMISLSCKHHMPLGNHFSSPSGTKVRLYQYLH